MPQEAAKSPAQLMVALERAGFDPSGLKPIGVRPSLRDYLRDLWDRRFFIWMEASQKALLSNAGNILGNAWLVLRPLIDAMFYFVVFG